jgi:hypothetical protein
VLARGGNIFLTYQLSSSSATEPIEIHSMLDGSLLGSLPGMIVYAGPSFGVATDGSYVWGATTSALATWKPNGTPLMTRPGAYVTFNMTSAIVGAPGELRIGNGPAGASVIEHVNATTGASTTTAPFSGGFQSWFPDGTRFVSNAGGMNLFVYDANAMRLALFPVSQAGGGGAGDFVVNGSQLFQVDGNGQPVAGVTANNVSGDIVWSLSPTGGDTITASLLGAQLTTRTLPVPSALYGLLGLEWTPNAVPLQTGVWLSAAGDSAGPFTLSNNAASMYFVGTSTSSSASGMLGCGEVLGMAGSAAGTAVVATTSGNLFVIDVPTGVVRADLGIAADVVALSEDGKTLALATRVDPGTQNVSAMVVSLPGGAPVSSFTYQASPPLGGTPPYLFGVGLSRDGSTLVRVVGLASGGREADVTDLSGSISKSTISDPMNLLVSTPLLSPSGAYVAATSGMFDSPLTYSTRLYAQGKLVNAVNGTAIGWTDDNHLLVQVQNPMLRQPTAQSTLYDNQGNVLATPKLPLISSIDALGPTTALASDGNIYDLTTGAVVKAVAGGVVAGSHVLSVAGASLVATPY